MVRPSLVKSDVVMAIQARLKALGATDLEADGVFGADTEDAVRLFQARFQGTDGQPLSIDGVVGPMTWAALFEAAVPAVTAPASDLAGRALAVAVTQLAVRENPLGSNRGPEVEAYLASVGLGGGFAWCAAFVHWCFDKAAAGGANPCPRTGGVLDMWARTGATGRLRHPAAIVRTHPEVVKPGQLFFLDTGGGTGHVGFIEGVQGVVLTTIEGNTNVGGSREGIGVFRRTTRRIPDISLGVADVTRPMI